MPDPKNDKRPIIVIKKKGGHAGHHGGAWKVAYADFVTAMMSLFIVLWLMSSSDQVKKAIAGYFNDPRGSAQQIGSAAAGTTETLSVDQANVAKLKDQIKQAIAKQPDLAKLANQIDITVTGEGLRIDLLEGSGGTFFESGSPKLSSSGVQLLALLAGQLRTLPNQVLIEGHTDSQPFSSANGYTNWELSADRANSARRLLQQGGIRPGQISQVRGYADQNLRNPASPLDPSNRRVSLIVQWVDASTPPVPSNTVPSPAGPTTPPAPAASAAAPAAPAASASGSGSKAAPTPAASASTGWGSQPSSSTPTPATTAPANAKSSAPSVPAAASPKPAPTTGVLSRLKSILPTKKT